MVKRAYGRKIPCQFRFLQSGRPGAAPIRLSDEQWRQIEPHLPKDVRGKSRVGWTTPSFSV